jgi:hypothetical protein
LAPDNGLAAQAEEEASGFSWARWDGKVCCQPPVHGSQVNHPLGKINAMRAYRKVLGNVDSQVERGPGSHYERDCQPGQKQALWPPLAGELL